MASSAKDIADGRGPITLEQAAYVVIGVLAAALRLFELGTRPLTENEAVQALAAFRFTHGTDSVAPVGTLPALFTGNVAGFTLLGASDAGARWLTAVAGLVLVLLPFGLRHRLGRGGALAASLLLALSPSAVFFSRNLDGAILVAACGLALVVGLVNYLDRRRPLSLYLAAVALGLGLCAGAAIYTLLLILVVYAALLSALHWLQTRRAEITGALTWESGWSSLADAVSALRADKSLLSGLSLTLTATFTLMATAFVLYPAGLGLAADLVAEWARGFLPVPQGAPVAYPLVLLLRYESLILVMGLVEVVWVMARRGRGRDWAKAGLPPASSFSHTSLLLVWTLVGLFVILAEGHRPVGSVLLVVVPLALLAGQGMERAWRWLAGQTVWRQSAAFAGLALSFGVFAYLQLAAYALTDNQSTVTAAGITLYASTTYLLLAVVAIGLLAGLGVAAWAWRGMAPVAGGGWLVLVMALGMVGFRAMWAASFARATDPRELIVGQATPSDVRAFVRAVEELSLAEAGDTHTLPVTIDADTGPVVAWYLREFGRQTVVEDLYAPPSTVAAITLAVQDLPIGETFRGTSFPLRTYWLPWGQWGQRLVRWLLFTEGSQAIVDREIVLWVSSLP